MPLAWMDEKHNVDLWQINITHLKLRMFYTGGSLAVQIVICFVQYVIFTNFNVFVFRWSLQHRRSKLNSRSQTAARKLFTPLSKHLS